MPVKRPTGTVTFLFADIEGSTRLLQTLGARYGGLLSDYHRLVRELEVSHRGVEVDESGDGFLIAFSTAADAAAAAVALQREMANRPWPDGIQVRVRIGIHTGEIDMIGSDYVGVELHRAARIGALAYGGQVLASSATVSLLGNRLGDEVQLVDLGSHRLKDLDDPSQLYQISIDGLPDHFPSPRSVGSAVPTNLPAHLTSFVGRADEIRKVSSLLEAGRLVTLTGVGGTGKTRLAIEVASTVAEGYLDGVWFVELGSVTDAESVPRVVATALGIRDQRGESTVDTIIATLRDATALLVLDNCEHLLSAVGSFARSLLVACPRVRVLATSRESLGVEGEAVTIVPSLEVPPTGEEGVTVMAYSSVRLFAERAELVSSGFSVDESNAGAVAQICRRLDGVPLAIELAAARVRTLSPADISQLLANRFRLLTGGSAGAVPRHATLEAAVSWSYELLREQERWMFDRLCVFVGGFDLSAAHSVCTQEGMGEFEILDLLSGLVDKSMIIVDRDVDGVTRYRMLETLREFGRGRLVSRDLLNETRDLHARHFVELAERLARDRLGPDQRGRFRQFEADHDNFLATIAWLDAKGEPRSLVRLVTALSPFWDDLGYWSVARRHHILARKAVDEVEPKSKAHLLLAGVVVAVPEDPEEAAALASEALHIAESLADPVLRAEALVALGYSSIHRFRAGEAVETLEEAVRVAREVGEDWVIAKALSSLGNALSYTARSDEAADVLVEAATLAERAGDLALAAESLGLTGSTYLREGNGDEALAYARRCLDLYRDLGSRIGEGHALLTVGETLLAHGTRDEAVEALWEAHRLLAGVGDRHCVARAERSLAVADMEAGELDAALKRLQTSVETSHRVKDRLNLARSMENLGSLAARRGDDERAALLFGAGVALRRAIGVERLGGEGHEGEAERRRIEERRSHPSIEAAWLRGEAMTEDEAVRAILR